MRTPLAPPAPPAPPTAAWVVAARMVAASTIAAWTIAIWTIAIWSVGSVPAAAAPPVPATAVDFAALPGIGADDLAAALATFRASCPAATGAVAPSRAAVPPPAGLRRACRQALVMASAGAEAARRFFAASFTPYRIEAPAFFTGYYEPVVEGSLAATPAFAVPLLAPPAGFAPGSPASYRLADGAAAPVPDRAGIEAGALGAAARPLVYLREPVDAFFVAVQGSARVRLPDGSLRRVAFAGRNGYPYTAIGRLVVAETGIPPERMGMAELRQHIRDAGQGRDEPGGRLMARNRSYVFFRFDEALTPDAGPVGAAGVSLTPLRSLAIDRSVWPYGLPMAVATGLPAGDGATTPFARLMVAQDTGSAITGAARADIFFGTGPEAASRAGGVRQPGTLFVLWPKDAGQPDDGVRGARP